MKRLFKILPVVTAAAIAALFLCSCEVSDVVAFVLPAETVDRPLNAEPDSEPPSGDALPSMMIQERHTERLKDTPPSEMDVDPAGYTAVSALLGLTRAEAEAALQEAGVAYLVEEVRDPSPAGVVCAMEYAGFRQDGTHYINPVHPVRLTVSAQKPVLPDPTVENTIYITFDDGPTEDGTEEILDILDSYGIKATFFMVGNSVKEHPDAAKAVYERGHAVACHSMTHQYEYIYADPGNILGEVDEWVALMESLGVDFSLVPKIFRYPGGSSSSYFDAPFRDSVNAGLEERGFFFYDWNIVANDALLFQCPDGTTTYDYVKNTFLETYAVQKGSDKPKILLLHETVEETRTVLPWMIEYLLADGCTFAALPIDG